MIITLLIKLYYYIEQEHAKHLSNINDYLVFQH